MKFFDSLKKWQAYNTHIQALFSWATVQLYEGKQVVILGKIECACQLTIDKKKRRRVQWFPKRDPQKTVIIACGPGAFSKIPQEFCRNERMWRQIFHSPFVEIWEDAGRFPENELPLRFGFNEEEREEILLCARSSLQNLFSSVEKKPQRVYRHSGHRLNELATVDVAIWVDGSLRGSRIVERKPFFCAVSEATVQAARDPRFKPLEEEELGTARIEVTWMSDLHMPLTKSEEERGEIYNEKGYCLFSRGTYGWYLPAVHNCMQHGTLDTFLKSLARDKAGIPESDISGASISVYEVVDFIEGASNSRQPIQLHGPVIKKVSGAHREVTSTAIDIEILRKHLQLASEWFVRIQNKDGFIPANINPFSGARPNADWVRMAFTAFALAEYGHAVNDGKILSVAEKLFNFLKRYEHIPQGTHRLLFWAYMGHATLSLGRRLAAQDSVAILQTQNSNVPFHPIVYSQTATLLYRAQKENQNYDAMAHRLHTALQSAFNAQKVKNTVSLASYAELLAMDFWEKREELSHEKNISEWYRSLQRPDGAFPDTPVSNYAYVRGTGKIFETLAAHPSKYEKEISRVLEWLFRMQYTDDMLFHIPVRLRDLFLGGFRHDMLNRDAWIDSAGHFLLGGSRIILNYKNELSAIAKNDNRSNPDK